MVRYGTAIDLKRCVAGNACAAACKSEHNTPAGIFQTKVLEKEMGMFPGANRVFVPVLRNRCEKPVGAEACPTGATHKRADGIVMIDYEKRIACLACIEHCPYRVRTPVRATAARSIPTATRPSRSLFTRRSATRS